MLRRLNIEKQNSLEGENGMGKRKNLSIISSLTNLGLLYVFGSQKILQVILMCKLIVVQVHVVMLQLFIPGTEIQSYHCMLSDPTAYGCKNGPILPDTEYSQTIKITSK